MDEPTPSCLRLFCRSCTLPALQNGGRSLSSRDILLRRYPPGGADVRSFTRADTVHGSAVAFRNSCRLYTHRPVQHTTESRNFVY